MSEDKEEERKSDEDSPLQPLNDAPAPPLSSLTSHLETSNLECNTKSIPFELAWAHGSSSSLPVINITKKDRPVIFYAASHVAILFNYKLHEMKLLQGHKNSISTICTDNTGKWVVTADAGTDSAVIVWDVELCIPICSLFDPYPNHGIRVVGMSPNAKYLVTVSNEVHQIVSFWEWTYGRNKPDASCLLPDNMKPVKSVVFNPDHNESFMLTTDDRVAFINYEDGKLETHIPTLSVYTHQNLGIMNNSTYQKRTHVALTATSQGNVILWSDTDPIASYFDDASSTIEKELLKILRLQKSSITVIKEIDELVVTGNERGRVNFYDRHLCILQWIQPFELTAITGISFNLLKKKCATKETLATSSSRIKSEMSPPCLHSGNQTLHCKEKTDSDVVIYDKIPTDATLHQKPFVVRDFIVSTVTGYCGYVDFISNKLTRVLGESQYPIQALACHPMKTQIAYGTTVGAVFLNDYKTNDYIVHTTLPRKMAQVKSMRFSPSAWYLAVGLDNGFLWLLNTTQLKPIRPPFDHSKGALLQIIFSDDSKHLATKDDQMCVCLYKIEEGTVSRWIYMGKQRSHYKQISDIVFLKDTETGDLRLFSLGEDRVLVEYDVKNSQPGTLKVLRSERIEQTSIPLAMCAYPKFTAEQFILTCDDEYKFKLYNAETTMCRKTRLAPTYGTPIRRIQILPQLDEEKGYGYMVFATKEKIGIQKLPVDGNPFKSIAVIGHPFKILDLDVCCEGEYLFTSGKDDCCILKWKINLRAVDVLERLGGEGITPFYSLLEGGRSGHFFKELEDLFYYANLRHQGEFTSSVRKVSRCIPLSVVPDMLRAAGYYPSDFEVENIMHELQYQNYPDSKDADTEVDFDDLLCLYINHRPATGVSLTQLSNAVKILADEGSSGVPLQQFYSILEEEGECMAESEIEKYMCILYGQPYDDEAETDDAILARSFEKAEEKLFELDGEVHEAGVEIPEELGFYEFPRVIMGISLDSRMKQKSTGS